MQRREFLRSAAAAVAGLVHRDIKPANVLLAPGGRCVVVDVHNARPGLQGHLVNLLAGADIRRRSWEPLEGVGSGFARRALPSQPLHGGELFLATAEKPGGTP